MARRMDAGFRIILRAIVFCKVKTNPIIKGTK